MGEFKEFAIFPETGSRLGNKARKLASHLSWIESPETLERGQAIHHALQLLQTHAKEHRRKFFETPPGHLAIGYGVAPVWAQLPTMNTAEQ